MTRDEALRLLGLPGAATLAEIDAAIAREYRTWNNRTNAPDFEARTAAQRRVNELSKAEVVLLGDRRGRPNHASPATDPAPPADRPRYAPPSGPPAAPASYSAAVPGMPPPPSAGYTPSYVNPGMPGPGGIPVVFVQSTSSLAIASLVCSLLWLCWAGSALGVLLGLFALLQIRNSNGAQKGKGLAWAGIVIGGAAIGILLLLVAAASTSPQSTY